MDASGTFQNLIHQIQTSSLNFKIEMSPFSACITLKNSFIRDRKGKAVIPLKPHQENVRKIKPESDDTAKKLVDQESLITSLKKEYEVAVNECENLVEEKVKLENVVDILHSKLTAAVQQNADLSDKASKDDLQHEVDDLKTQNSKSDLMIQKLNCQLNETKLKANAEKSEIIENFKKEIKSWKKDLGEERRLKIKLEYKLKEYLERSQLCIAKDTSGETSSQTDNHPDLPYQITALPPIFNLQLCRRTPRIHLSKSLLDLNTISCCPPEDVVLDAAEEALNDQYDRLINEFYSEAWEAAHAKRGTGGNGQWASTTSTSTDGFN